MKRQKPNPDTNCGHMPMNTISLEAMCKAAYEPESKLNTEEKKLKSHLQKLAEKLGANNTEEIPEFFLNLQYCCWTQADMSDVSWENRSFEAKIAIQFCSHDRKKRLSHRHCGSPIKEKELPEGTYYLIPNLQLANTYNFKKNSPPELYADNFLTRILIKPNGEMEIGSTISVDDKTIKQITLRYDKFLEFFNNPVHHLTCFQLENLIKNALNMHPEWYPTILRAVTGVNFVYNGRTPQSRYTEVLENTLSNKLAQSVQSLNEVHVSVMGYKQSGTVEFNEDQK